jgi:hypothetical protein
LVDANLVELSKGEYGATTIMPTKKNIFGNWTKCHMCENYCLTNKWTRLDKYAMPLFEEILDALG